VQKCRLVLKYKKQSNMDERTVVLFYPEKVFLPLCLGKKIVFSNYNFSLGKDNQEISMLQYTLTWGLPSIKKTRQYFNLFQRQYKL